ncbi:hypothetical protein ACQKEM_19300 [Pseudomonas sp. NPDC077382]
MEALCQEVGFLVTRNDAVPYQGGIQKIHELFFIEIVDGMYVSRNIVIKRWDPPRPVNQAPGLLNIFSRKGTVISSAVGKERQLESPREQKGDRFEWHLLNANHLLIKQKGRS